MTDFDGLAVHHLDDTLGTLLDAMPGRSVAGRAEMTMTVLIYRELDIRKRDRNVLLFQPRGGQAK